MKSYRCCPKPKNPPLIQPDLLKRISNADRVGLYCRALPEGTLCFKSTSVSVAKNSKQNDSGGSMQHDLYR